MAQGQLWGQRIRQLVVGASLRQHHKEAQATRRHQGEDWGQNIRAQVGGLQPSVNTEAAGLDSRNRRYAAVWAQGSMELGYHFQRKGRDSCIISSRGMT